MFSKLKHLIRKNYIFIALLIILSIASFFRLYRISDYLTFLGDEGRDVAVVRGILHGDFVFIGPRASAADFFTGPIYYYMMAPFLLFSNYHPVGPAIMIALLSIATCYLIFRFGREWIGVPGALVAALLYAIAPLVIQYSRSSWNPNPMPFFTLLILYLLYTAVQNPKLKNFIIIGVLYGIAFQLHYIEMFVGVIMASFILFGNFMISRKDLLVRISKQYLMVLCGFVVGISPFLAFELKNGFPNTKTIFNFILLGDPKAADLTHLSFIETILNVFFRLFGRVVMYYPPPDKVSLYDKNTLFLWGLAVVAVGVISTVLIFKIKDKFVRLLLFFWIFFGVILFGFYHKPIYDYYFEFMFPLPFILVGNAISYFWSKKHLFKIIAIASIFLLLYLNWLGYPFRNIGNKQYEQVKMISKFIIEKSENQPYNFALITGGNSDHAYRYIFDIEGKTPVTILGLDSDPERRSVTNQLFVVCEENPCHPLGHSLWEVAGFGRAEIEDEWPVSVLKVYKLVHFKE